MIHERDSSSHARYIVLGQATKPGELCALLFVINAWLLLRPTEVADIEVLWDRTSILSTLSKKT